MKQLVFVIVAALLITYALFSFIDRARPGIYMAPAAPSVSVSGLSYRKTESSYDSTWYSWKADIRNASTGRVEAFCRLQLLDKDGFEVGSDLSNVNLAPGETRTLTEKDYVASYLWPQVTRASISCDVHGLPQDIVVTNVGTEAVAGKASAMPRAPTPTAASPSIESAQVSPEETPTELSQTEPASIITISNLGYSRADFTYDSTTYSWRADIRNTSTDSIEAVCTLRLFDWDGVEIGSAQAIVNLAPGETLKLREKRNIANYLWPKVTRADMSCDVR